MLAESHGDVFAENRKIPGFHVHSSDGGSYELEGVDEQAATKLVGKPVRLRGAERNGKVKVEAGTLAADGTGTGTTGTGSAVTAPGMRTVAVLMVNFADNPQTPWTADAVAGAYFGAANSANAYFQDSSDGRIGFSGEVFGWLTISRASTTTCDWSAWGTAASAAATSAGIDLSAFQHISYVWPNTACTWAGLGYMPGTRTYMDGTIGTSVIAHELGHNLGVHHAGSLSCTGAGGAPVPVSSTCSVSEYGDPFDVMGNGNKLLQGYHRAQLGWLPESVTLSAGGTATIVPVDSAGLGTRLVRIPRGDGTFLDIDFRQPTGVFDTFGSTSAVVNGVTLRINPNLTTITPSQLVDVTPTSPASFSDSSLKVGQAYTDPVSTATVRVVSLSASGATIEVTYGPDTLAPSAPTNLQASLSGANVVLNWSAATDNRGVAGYRVRRGTSSTDVSATSFSEVAVPGTTMTYQVLAFDAAGNVSAETSVSINVPTPDTTAPSAPTGLGASVAKSRIVTLTWTASTDDRGVTGYQVTRNTTRLASVTTTKATDKPGSGTWTYTVVAVDAAGNTSSPTTISVRVP